MARDCSKKHNSTFTGTFVVTGGTGDFNNASGNGEISLIIGKKYFAGKLTGEVTTP